MLQPTQESLEITISKIMKNKILLPDFQRQFVWKDEESQCKLIASVLTKMPLGSILLLRAQDASEYACKPLGSRVRLDTSKVQNGQVEFLLDGQQRMTTLFLLHWYLWVKEMNKEGNDIPDYLKK